MELNAQFEYSFEVLTPLEVEISLKSYAQCSFNKKIGKNHKSPGRDLKTQFLPNKKYFSVVSDGNRNFLEGDPENLFLTSPPPLLVTN